MPQTFELAPDLPHASGRDPLRHAHLRRVPRGAAVTDEAAADEAVVGAEDGVEDVGSVLSVLAGDDDSFAELVARHEGHLARLLRGLLGDSHLAEDVLQEVWMIVLVHLPALRRRHRFGWWVRRIAVREGLRARERWRRGLELARAVDAAEELEDRAGDPALSVDRREEIERSLAALRPMERRAMVLVVGGASYAEAARTLGQPMGSIATWLHRARRRLVS